MDKFYDMAERAGWTGVEALLAVAITDLGDVSLWWAAPLAMVLTAAKVWVANRLKAARG